MDQGKRIGNTKAIAMVVANMIGTGVYTSLGFQASGIKSIPALLFIWIIGGIVAICGALTYGELASRIPKSGGEYQYLGRIYHPFLGFLSGMVSVTVGFAAPIAISAIAFGQYFTNILPFQPQMVAVALIILLTLINTTSFKMGTDFQLITTIVNISLIVIIIISGLLLSDHSHFSMSGGGNTLNQVFSPAFAVSLVYVSYSYSGWNSATYITRQVNDPVKNLPVILFIGTAIVMILYLALNFIFLYSTPISLLEGNVDVAFISATRIFGATGGKIIGAVICIGLIASINCMMITGPRVSHAIVSDYKLFNGTLHFVKRHLSIIATIFQSTIALILILSSSFDKVMTYIGFTLALFTMLTVGGVFIVRLTAKRKQVNSYKTWGYPFVPILFLLIEGCMIAYIFIERPMESLAGIGTVLSFIILFFLLHTRKLRIAKINV